MVTMSRSSSIASSSELSRSSSSPLLEGVLSKLCRTDGSVKRRRLVLSETRLDYYRIGTPSADSRSRRSSAL